MSPSFCRRLDIVPTEARKANYLVGKNGTFTTVLWLTGIRSIMFTMRADIGDLNVLESTELCHKNGPVFFGDRRCDGPSHTLQTTVNPRELIASYTHGRTCAGRKVVEPSNPWGF